jgi:Rrf2 family transcriptional regulator, nitric oxide-sensitive transcriptional repressor
MDIGYDLRKVRRRFGATMISRTNEYALRVMVFLAGQEGKPTGTQTIAEATQVPVGYLSKILLELVKKHFIHSQRGRHGGFVLAHDPKRLSVYDVVSAIDPVPRIHQCPLGVTAHKKQLCPLHRELDQAYERVETAFKKATLASLVDPTMERQSLCKLVTRKPPRGRLGVR